MFSLFICFYTYEKRRQTSATVYGGGDLVVACLETRRRDSCQLRGCSLVPKSNKHKYMYYNSFVPIHPRFAHGWQPTGQRERCFVMAVRMGLFAAFPRERPRSGCPSARVSPRRLTCATAHICLEGLVTQTYTKPRRVATETSLSLFILTSFFSICNFAFCPICNLCRDNPAQFLAFGSWRV
jgi:hypothetical protein